MPRYQISIYNSSGTKIAGAPIITDEEILWTEREKETLVLTEGYDLVIERRNYPTEDEKDTPDGE